MYGGPAFIEDALRKEGDCVNVPVIVLCGSVDEARRLFLDAVREWEGKCKYTRGDNFMMRFMNGYIRFIPTSDIQYRIAGLHDAIAYITEYSTHKLTIADVCYVSARCKQ